MPRKVTDKREVTFITPSGEMMIRMMDASYNDICEAATQLKATHFVMIDDVMVGSMLPVWGVFSMRGVEKSLGNWVINDPIRTFEAETSDAAVMFAQHIGRV